MLSLPSLIKAGLTFLICLTFTWFLTQLLGGFSLYHPLLPPWGKLSQLISKIRQHDTLPKTPSCYWSSVKGFWLPGDFQPWHPSTSDPLVLMQYVSPISQGDTTVGQHLTKCVSMACLLLDAKTHAEQEGLCQRNCSAAGVKQRGRYILIASFPRVSKMPR